VEVHGDVASIRERTGRRGTTYAVLYREDGAQRSDTFTTRTAARRHAERIDRLGASAARRILDAEAGHDPEAMPTVAEQVVRHIDALSGVQAASIAGYRTIARQLADTALGALPLDTATREDVAAWIRGQERAGSSAKTIKNRQALLSAALTRAVDDGLVPRNVAARARITRTERREMTFLTPGEFQVLLARATPHYRPLLMWLYGTGMRLGEATALRVSDVHLEFTPATVTVTRAWKRGGTLGPPKTAAGRRTLAIPRPVVEAIGPLLDREPDALLFTNTRGRRVLQASLHDLWQGWIADWTINGRTGARARRRPSLGKTPRIHDLRHSHAAFMIGQGVSLYDLKRRLGHESIQTTADTYGHLMPEAQVQAERASSLAFRAGSGDVPAIAAGCAAG
jgi:integrase